MDDRKPVGAGALFATAFVGTVVSAASVSPHLFGEGSYLEALLTVLLSLVLTSLAAVPTLLLNHEGTGLMEAARLCLGKGAWVVEIFYYAVLLYYDFYFLSCFLVFIENTLNPSTPVWLVSVCVVLTAAYGASRGLRAVSRAGTLAFALVLVGFGLIFCMLFRQIDPVNLLHTEPISLHASSAALFIAGRMTSLVQLLLFLPQAKGHRVAGYWACNTGFHLLCAVLVFFLGACLGPMAATQLFPVHTLALLANLGAVQRLDIVFLALWITGTVLRLCLDFTAGASLFCFHDRHLLGEKQRRIPPKVWLVLLQAAAVAVPAAWVADTLPLQRWLFSSQLLTLLAVLAGVVVPTCILCLWRLRRGRKEG